MMFRTFMVASVAALLISCGEDDNEKKSAKEQVKREQVTLNCQFSSPPAPTKDRFGRPLPPNARESSVVDRKGAFSISIQLEELENSNNDDDDDPRLKSVALIHQLDGFADPTIEPMVRNYLSVFRNDLNLVVTPERMRVTSNEVVAPLPRLIINRASLSLDIQAERDEDDAPGRDGSCSRESWIPIPEPQL